MAFVHAEGAFCGHYLPQNGICPRRRGLVWMQCAIGKIGEEGNGWEGRDGKGAMGKEPWEGDGGKGTGEMGAVSNKKEEPHRSSSFLYWVIQITPEFF
ncbi:MAG: hypothetical protein IKA14_07665 [Bacteroidales bacterium]|nr:hypothetical protein [Bacteroidales bacterium]